MSVISKLCCSLESGISKKYQCLDPTPIHSDSGVGYGLGIGVLFIYF